MDKRVLPGCPDFVNPFHALGGPTRVRGSLFSFLIAMLWLQSERLRWILTALTLTAIAAVPPALALLDPSSASTVQLVERTTAALFLAAGILGLLWTRLRPSARASAGNESEQQTGADRETARSAQIHALLQRLLVFAPMLPILLYLPVFSDGAYAGLFLSDQDFTNLSSAINNTARSEGFLVTPFLQTGDSGSYLGHHFSPTTAIYAPFYWLYTLPGEFGFETQITHALYAILLWATIALGLWLWAQLFLEECGDTSAAIVATSVAALSFPLWRFALSYHYEAPILPLSALCLLFLKRGHMLPFWICLVLWLGVKEDIAVYVGLFGLYVIANRERAPNAPGRPPAPIPRNVRRGLAIALAAALWFWLARSGMRYFAGGAEAVDWSGYWNADLWETPRNLAVYLWIVAAFGLLPLLRLRLTLLLLAPIFALHFASGHPWHHAFLGHYSYSVLPFLFLGLAGGMHRVVFWMRLWDLDRYRPAMFALALALAWFAAAYDRYTPTPALRPDPRYPVVERMLQALPPDACIQTQAPFTAHAPLRLRVFPLMIPQRNPYHDLLPGPHNFARFHFAEDDALCDRYYLLLDPDEPRPPVYQQEHLDAFQSFAERNLQLREAKEGLRLYEFYVRGP